MSETVVTFSLAESANSIGVNPRYVMYVTAADRANTSTITVTDAAQGGVAGVTRHKVLGSVREVSLMLSGKS